jgi:hypothetical protein
MKDFPGVQTLIRESLSVTESAGARIEWNLNRYFSPTFTNPASTQAIDDAWDAWGGGDTLFPIESLSGVDKRGSGIAYIINDPAANASYKFYDYARMTETTRQSLPARFYYVNPESRYKYWVSPVRSAWSVSSPYTLANTAPTADYGSTIQANKISVKFNVHITRPVNWTVQISTNGSSWTTIATDVSVPLSSNAKAGQVDLYAPTGGGAWTTTPVYYAVDGSVNNLKSFRYIKVSVTTISRANARLEVLEISPRIHVDATPYLMAPSANDELSNGSDFAPVGTITSNTGSLKMANYNGFFSKKSGMSPVSAYLDEFAKVTMFTKYLGNTEVEIGTTMFVNKWNFSEEGSGTIDLIDETRILQETPAPDMYIRNVRPTTAIWMMLDDVGFKDVKILESEENETPIMEAFYCRKEDKLWEVITKLAKDFQLSVHMASDGLRVMTKEYIYNTRAATWTIRQTASGNEKPDLKNYSTSSTQASNKISLNYSAVNDYNLSGGKTQIFWQAPETWTIGAAQLTRDLLTTDDYAYIRADQPENMPRNKGRFKVDGEWLRYTAKEYRLTSGLNVWVSDESDWFKRVESNNGRPPVFTGRLKLAARAKENHRGGNWKLQNVYRMRRVQDSNPGATVPYPQGVKLNNYGLLNMTNPYTNFGTNPRSNRVMALRNWGGAFNRIGMKFKITSQTHGTVGMVLYPQGTYDHKGYAFSVTMITDPSQKASTSIVGETRGHRYEGDGSATPLTVASPKATKEFEWTAYFEKHHTIVKKDTWHWMEIILSSDYRDRKTFAVYIDGRCVKVFYEPGGTFMTRNYWGGPYVTAGTTAQIDKVFCIDYPSGKELKRLPDGIKRWYPDNQWLLAVSSNEAKQNKMNLIDYRYHVYLSAFKGYKKIRLMVDEFGGLGYPYIREILEEDVRYKVFPSRTSKVYHSNKNVSVLNYRPGPHGAKFTLINSSNSLQFLAKEAGSYSDIPQSGNKDAFYLWGRAVFRMDPQKIERKDEVSVRQRGEQVLELETDWIQTRSIAETMTDWIFNNVKDPRDRYEIDIFGNPLIEVGDSVNIIHTEINAGTFVVSKVSHEWDNGLSTKVTVVRTS